MKIALLTRQSSYYSERRIVEEALKRGHEIKAIRYSDCALLLNGTDGQVVVGGDSVNNYEVIIPRVTPPMVSYGATIVRQLEASGLYSINGSVSLARSWDKLRSLQVLSKAGVTVPKTIMSRDDEVAESFLDVIGLPCIVRSTVGYGDGSSVLAETRSSAVSVMKAFSVSNKTFIVQEYVRSEGGIMAAYVLGSSVAASMQLPAINSDEVEKAKPLSENQKKIALKAAKSLGLSFCRVELGGNTDRPVVIDVNPVPGLETIERVTKRNIAEKLVEYIEISARRQPKKDKIGA